MGANAATPQPGAKKQKAHARTQPQSSDEFAEAIGRVEEAAGQLFNVDRRVHSVGVALKANGKPFYRAVRNVKKIVEQAAVQPMLTLKAVNTGLKLPFPVVFVDAQNDAAPLFRMPFNAATGAAGGGLQEQQLKRPLRCGLQIQNFDDDNRQGIFNHGVIVVGSIGCFVKKNGVGPFILSNNHVIAGENRGKTNDRILQSGSTSFQNNELVAQLTNFVPIKFSPVGATVIAGNVILNDIDAGIARVGSGIDAKNAYLPGRTGFKPPAKIGTINANDAVSKIGRTTGPTRGTVTSVAAVVGPIDYNGQPAWFRNAIEIEGVNGSLFSDHGDSGSAIVNAAGELVGLLYAGNGSQTYACPIDKVVAALGITM